MLSSRSTPSVYVCALIALLSARPASAQVAKELPAQPSLKMPAVMWATSAIADQITTYHFASRYHDLLHEENPLIKSLDNHPVWLVAAGSAIDAASGWAVYRFVAPRHPRLARLAFFGAAAYRTYLVTHNVRMMQRADAIRRSW